MNGPLRLAPVSPSRLFRPLFLLLAPALLAVLGWAQPVINTPTTSFIAAESGRTYMTVGDVWNGSAKVGATTGDTLRVTYTNSGTATAYDLALSVTLPTGFTYVPDTATVSTNPSTSGLSVSASQSGTLVTFALSLAGKAYDLPAGTTLTLNYGVRTATTVVSGTYQPIYSRNYALTDGGALVGATTTQQSVLVQAGDTTIDLTPNQQLKAVGETANFTVTVTNTGLGGIFDVTIDESALYPTGNNLQFVSLTQTAPALAATASNGGSILTLPYLAPGASFTADVTAVVLSCGTIVNNVTSVHLANAVAEADSAPVQLDLRQPLVAYTPPSVTLDYTAPVSVSIPINNTGLGSAYTFRLQSTLHTLPLTVSAVAAGWSYNSSSGLFTYTANSGTIGNGGSAPLTFNLAPSNICTAIGAGTVNYVANYTNGCGDAYTIPLQTQTIAAPANAPTITLTQNASANRIAILEPGSYTITLAATNPTNIANTNLVVTETLPASITYLGSTPSSGTVGVAGQTLTWTVPKTALSSAQTLTINFSVNNDPCNAGTLPVASASTSGTSTQSCTLNATANASFLISNNPGLAASQYFNVTPAANGLYETGTASADLVRDTGEGEFIPFEANYSFGAVYPGTWTSSTYTDAFGGVTGMALVSGSLTVKLDGGPAVAVPGAAVTTLSPGFRIDLGFLAGPGYFNGANVAGHSVTFNYRTSAPDSAVNPGSTRAVTQLTTFELAGAGGSTSGGCNTPTQSTFTQGAFYTLGRAAATIGVNLTPTLEVCKEETLTLTVGNGNAELARNLQITLANGAAFTYNPAQTPVYGGVFNAGNITYAANGGLNPTFLYTGNPLTGTGTIQVRVTRKATGDTNLTGLSANVAYDSWQTAAAAARVYTTTANYTPTSVRKASLAVNVTPGSLTVTGSTITYVTYVSNTDAGTAFGAVLANTLPAGITLDTETTAATNAANPGYPVTISGQNLSWALGDIASGATIPITLVAKVGIIPGCSLSITTERITATWGCDSAIHATVSKVPPSFVFPAGKMQVVHDSTQTVARLCNLGKIVLIVKNTGPTNIEGVIVRDVVPPTDGFSISGIVQYRLNGGALQSALIAPAGTGTTLDPYVWTSTQIPALAKLVPAGASGTNQVSIEFNLAATETLAGLSPVLSASAQATISCGDTVSSPPQPFTIPIERPSITVTKTGRNTTANPAAAFDTTVYGGVNDYVEWKIVVANNGNATAGNMRLSDPLSGSGGTAVINGPGLTANTVFTPGMIITLPDLPASSSGTYVITEILGNNCLTSSRTADVTWGCTNNGAAARSNVSTPGAPTSAATIAMTPVIVSGTELTQTITQLSGGRGKITVNFSNSGGTAYNPVVTATIPAGSTFDTTGPVSFTSTNASITGVALTGTATVPIFTFTGPGTRLVRYGESASVTYYVRPTVFDTQNATSFTAAAGSNLVSPETTLDPTVPATANVTAKLDYTNSCGTAASQTNTASYNPLTPDLDITASAPGNRLLTAAGANANYTFTISNAGEASSLADFITADFPGLGTSWTINSITVTAATAGTGGTVATVGAAATQVGGIWTFSPAQLGTLGTGGSIVITVNAAYSGTPGPLALKLRVTGESRANDGTTVTGNYSLDQRAQRIVGVTTSKALQSTSETLSTTSNVLIGEEVTYRIRADFFGVEDDITGLIIRDTPADSNFNAHTGLAYVSHAYTGSNEIVPDSVTAPTPVTAPASLAASRIAFNRATLSAATVNGGTNTFEDDVTVRVLNIAGNSDAKALRNNLGISFTYLGQVFRSNDTDDGFAVGTTSAGLHAQTDITVRCPQLALVKTVRNVTRSGAFAATAAGEAGDVIEYKIVVSNPAATTPAGQHPLFDVTVTDVLPAKLNLSSTNQGADTNATPATIEVANTAATSGLGATITFNQTNTAIATAGSNFTRLDSGQTLTLLYRGTLAATVIPNETLANTATAIGYSLTLPSGNQTSPTGTENTPTGATRYTASATAANVTIDNIVQQKIIVTTSEAGSTNPAVFVGEQIHYRVALQLPQGTVPNLQVTDQLPQGFALVSTPAISFGAGISPSTQPTIAPSSLPANGSPLNISWDFGSRVATGALAADRTVIIEYIAQVRNLTANAAGTNLVNNATYSYSGAPVNLNQITITVAAPAVVVAHAVRNVTTSGTFAATATADAGDVVEYRVIVTNPSAANVAPAYDLALADTLPAGLTFVSGSTTVTTNTGVTGALGAPDVAGQTLTWGRTQATPVNLDLAVAGNLTFTYRATVDDTAKPLQAYTNAFIADWTSLDGAPGANLGVALATPGNDMGERTGTGTAPNTFRSALNTTITAVNSTTVAKAKSGDTLPLSAPAAGFRIGDLVTYTVTVTAQEGTLTPFRIIDILPPGLAFESTVSILPATGTAPFTSYTTPVAGSTAPASGATGTLTWDFGTLVNAGDNLANNDLVLTYTARVINTGTGNLAVPAVSPASTTTACANSATASYQNAAAGTLTTTAAIASLNVEQPRLTIAKAVLSPTADALGNYVRRPGDTASFQVTVTNNGTAPAYNLRLTDTLPAGLRGTSPTLTAATLNGASILGSFVTPPVWTAAAGTYVFDLADTEILLPTQTLVLTYTVKVDNDNALKGTTLTNSATINQFFSKASADTTQRRQYAAVGPATKSLVIGLRIDGSVYHDADLSNAKNGAEDWSGANKPTVYANLVTTGGSPAVYQTVTVNPGTGLFTFDYLPPGTYNVVVTNSAAGTTAARPANWLFQSPTTGTINEVLTNADLANQDLGLNQGSYSAPHVAKAKSGDTLPRTNADALGASPSAFRIGDLVTYTVDVNPQEGALTNFQVTDVLPAGLVFVSTSSIAVVAPTTSRYTYTALVAGSTSPAANATGTLTWNFGNFANAIAGPVNNSTPSAIATNNTLRLTYTARVTASGTGNLAVPGAAPATTTSTLTNSANLAYNNPGPVAAAAGPVTTNVTVEQPRLTIAKVRTLPTPGSLVVPGGTATFQVTVTNNGTAPAYATVLTDTLPTGMRTAAPVITAASLNGSAISPLTNVGTTYNSTTGVYTISLTNAQLLLPTQSFVLTYRTTIDNGATRGATLSNNIALTRFDSSTDATNRRRYTPGLTASASVTVGIGVSGSVYSDDDNSGAKNGAETWSGATKPTVYVNLLQGGAVVSSATVAPGTGAFSFTNLPAGTYDLILTDSASSTTATRPANWPFRSPASGKITFTLAAADVANQNFGLYLGSFAAPIIAKSKSGDTLPITAPASGFRIGDLVTYTVDVQPQEGALTNFQVTDVLHTGLAFEATSSITQVSGASRFTYTTPVAGSTAPASGATGNLTWNFGNLTNALNGTADNTLRIVYTARVLHTGGLAVPGVSPALTTTARANSARVSYTNPAPLSNSAAAGPVVASIDVAQPRLTIAKVLATPALNRMAPGAAGTFTITVTNDGTAPAYNLTLTDTLPVGLRGTAPGVTAATLNGSPVTLAPVWTAGAGTYVFTLADDQPITPGASLVITYSFAVDLTATRAATLSNAAALTEFFAKPSADTTERRRYTPGLTASAAVVVGLQISGSVYQDLGATPNNAKDAGEDWSGATPTVYVNLVNTTTNTVTASATIAPGAGTYTFTNQPAASYKLIVATSNSATTADRPANWPFQNPANGTLNLGAVSTDYTSQDFGLHQGTLAAPTLTKSHTTGTLPLATPANGYRIGDLVTYSIVIEPQEGALTSFQVTDALPAGLAFYDTTSITPATGGRYTYTTPAGANTPAANATGTVTWNFGTFTNALNGPTSNTLTITYRARVLNTGTGNLAAPAVAPATITQTLVNSAGLSYVNSASTTITAGPSTTSLDVEQPRLTLAKTRLTPVANNVALPGGTASFRLTLTNDGTAPAYNVSVKDIIPAGLRGTPPTLDAATLNGVNILSTLTAPGWNSGTGAWTFSLVDAQFNVGSQIQHILPGETLVLDYTVTLDADATKGATLLNSATIEAYYSKPVTDLAHRRTYAPVGPAVQPIIVGLNIDGYVYDDLSPNSLKDAFENWSTGTPVYVNLVDLGTGSVVASASVPIGTGTYSFTHIAPGSYRLVLTISSGNTTAAAPATWMFRAPVDGTRLITLSNADLTAQNFGLFRGRTLAGRVFRDTGLGGGTANDGRRNGTEPGIGNVIVRLLSASFSELAIARTDGAGNFLLSIPVSTATGATLVVEETNPAVHLSTGGYGGTTGGAYARATDRITFTYAGDDPTGLEFGDIPEDSLLTDGAQFILPGSAAFYRHTYTAGTAGNVTFTSSTASSPSLPWTQLIVHDLNGNGQIDAGEPSIDGTPITVTAGEEILLVVKANSPAGAPFGARNTLSLASAFTAATASPAILFHRTRQDITTIGTASAAGLQLVKTVDKDTAAPGEIITYTITYKNVGAEALSVFFIDDRTPAYTSFATAAAGPLPLNLTAVHITTPAVGATGTLRWEFTGTLAPGSTGTVTFQVQVQP